MDDTDSSLFKVPQSAYGESYRADYLAMYQQYVASADAISERRHTANQFFLSINSAIVAVTGYLAGDGQHLVWLAAIGGVAFCYAWKLLIDSYRSLNSAKFRVIHQLERNLPFAAYDEEWIQLKQGRDSKVHSPLSQREAMVPLIFIALHSIVFVVNVYERMS